MRLSKIAILAINGSKDCKRRLSEEMKVSSNTLWRWITENENNGDLTKAKSIQIIREETGLEDSQILEEDIVAEELVSGNPQS